VLLRFGRMARLRKNERGVRNFLAWEGKNDAGQPLRLYCLAWPQDYQPEMDVGLVQMWSKGGQFALLGITMAEARETLDEVLDKLLENPDEVDLEALEDALGEP